MTAKTQKIEVKEIEKDDDEVVELDWVSVEIAMKSGRVTEITMDEESADDLLNAFSVVDEEEDFSQPTEKINVFRYDDEDINVIHVIRIKEIEYIIFKSDAY